jgi:hypothetical protein
MNSDELSGDVPPSPQQPPSSRRTALRGALLGLAAGVLLLRRAGAAVFLQA